MIMLGSGNAGTGSSQHQSGGTSRARRSRRTRRSRQRGRPGRQSRRCRSSWRASGGRQPSGAPAGAQPAALLRVCCESAPCCGAASLHGMAKTAPVPVLRCKTGCRCHVLLVMQPIVRLCNQAKAARTLSCWHDLCGLAVQPDILAKEQPSIEWHPPPHLAHV